MLWATSASSINIAGADFLDQERLERLRRSSLSIVELRDSVLQACWAAGYLDAELAVSTAPDSSIVVLPNQLYRMRDLRLTGADSAAVRSLHEFDPDQPLSAPTFEHVLLAVVRLYAERGYPFAQVQPEHYSVENGQATIHVQLITGPRLPIGTVDYERLISTRPATLHRRLTIRPGDTYDERAVAQSILRLKGLDFITVGEQPDVRHDLIRDAAAVRFPVRDKRNFNLSGVAALGPDNSLSGIVDVALANLLGYGERLDLNWQRRDEFSRKLRLAASAPYIGGTPVDGNVALSQMDRDSSFINATLSVGLLGHLGADWQVGASGSWSKITPDAGRASPSARILAANFTTAFDGRDTEAIPRRGFRVLTLFGSSYRKAFAAGGAVTTGYSRDLRLSSEFWLPLGRSYYWYQRVSAFEVRSDFVPIPREQLIEIGGSETLRGYRERQFLARQGVALATELRWMIGSQFVLRGFCDNAYLGSESGALRLTGFGLGASLLSSAGWFKIDLSAGEIKQWDGLFVHFGFETNR